MSRSATALVAALLITFASQAAKPPPPPHVYGPVPDWPTFRRLAEKAVAEQLIDPESARFRWISGPKQGDYKPLGERRAYGYVACGTVNAHNRMGGYQGPAAFVVVIDNWLVQAIDLDLPDHGSILGDCTRAVAFGRMPTAPISDEASLTPFRHVADLDEPDPPSASGFTVQAMPDGAYVSTVAPGSAAAAAGIKPGMVIASVNAIPLGHMGDAMTKVLDAAGAGARLTMVGGATFTLPAR